MRLNSQVAFCLLARAVTNALPQGAPPTPAQPAAETATLPTEASTNTAVAASQLADLAEYAQQQANASLSSSKRGPCNLSNVAVRKEWGSLSNKERKAYTDAILCLQAKQARYPTSVFPGVRSRFDDFVGTHINQTNFIHYTGTFLAWHRYFTYEYEQSLRNECGYTGYQPYWDWAKTAASGLTNSPILDGSAYSMSGDGEYISNKGQVVLGGPGLPPLYLPPGSGGGCVKSGPFKNMSVNLGPVQLSTTDGTTVSNGDGLGYNPRCLKRDLTDAINRQFANASSVVSLILQNTNIWDFQMNMQGVPGSGSIGVHGGGHYAMGGDPGRDVFTSPGDPLFYLHHAMIDRVWWIWQLLDLRERTGAKGISGTGTFLNIPPSANTTLETTIDLGLAAGTTVKMEDLMSTTAGPFCYIYL